MDEIRCTSGAPDSVLSALSAATQEFFSHFQLFPFCYRFFLNAHVQYVVFPYFLFPQSLSFLPDSSNKLNFIKEIWIIFIHWAEYT